MLTEQCKIIIDDAITAGGDLSKLSPEAVAHIESCIECRRSLESIKALKASTTSVIPIAASLALKNKIASSLEGAMQARRASIASTASKSVIGTGSVILGLSLCGAITCGVVLLSNNKSYSEMGTSNNRKGESVVSVQKDSSSVSGKDDGLSSIENNNSVIASESSVIGNNEDLRNDDPKQNLTQKVPSVLKDSD
ncbi:MAG: hypothetical protein J6Z11_00370 [Candidatus Riflebacteria bacterium]|nr:hypothetical protein [Candidatus Riflebacteria bacterium]